jgi:hypothetical protein
MKGDEVLVEGVNDAYLHSLYADKMATTDYVKAGESVYDMVEIFKHFSNVDDTVIDKVFTDKEGGNLTQEDLDNRGELITNAKTVWEGMSNDSRNLFEGSIDKFIEYITGTFDAADKSFTTAADRLKSKYGDGAQFSGVSAGQANALSKIAANASTEGFGDGENFLTRFNDMIKSEEFKTLNSSEKELLVGGLAGLGNEPTNREDWETLM